MQPSEPIDLLTIEAAGAPVSRWRAMTSSPGVRAIVATLALSVLTVTLLSYAGGPGAIAQHGWITVAWWVPAQIAINLSPASDLVPFAVFNGAFYGLWAGALVSWIVWIVAASIQFAIARRTARDLDIERQMERLPGWLRRFPIAHPAVLIAGHWVPVSSALVNVAAGALGVSYSRLLCCTAIAMVPPAVVMSAIGSGLLRAF